jgi:hypothetical protein
VKTWTKGVIALVAVCAGSAIALYVTNLGQHRYLRNGEGVLASTEDSSNVQTLAFQQNGRGQGADTIGIRLCLRAGATSATIRAVVPAKAVGDSFEYLGARMRTIDIRPSSGDGPIGSVRGFPPALPQGASHPDRLQPVAGYVVKAACNDTATYDELLIGWQVASGVRGGGWIGIDVRYDVGGHTHVVKLPYTLVVCGPAVRTFVSLQSCPGA